MNELVVSEERRGTAKAPATGSLEKAAHCSNSCANHRVSKRPSAGTVAGAAPSA